MSESEILTALNAALGEQETTRDEVSGPLARRLAATLNQPLDGLETGADLPDGWHVILFTTEAPTSVLAEDGHPRTGGFLPELPLPRRMFAGRRVLFERPLKIGAAVERVSTISKAELKEGRSGLLAFLTITHDIRSEDALCIREEQTVVYRGEAGKGGGGKRAPETVPENAPWTETLTPTPPLLLRYSAITFNAHRIHYDETYVREVEGYPERVVNGGLTAIFLLEMARTHCNGGFREFQITNRGALYVNRPVTLIGMPDGEPETAKSAQLWAVDDTGAIASKGTLRWKAA
jgi:3-methylfumaryl-CoA hydratase